MAKAQPTTGLTTCPRAAFTTSKHAFSGSALRRAAFKPLAVEATCGHPSRAAPSYTMAPTLAASCDCIGPTVRDCSFGAGRRSHRSARSSTSAPGPVAFLAKSNLRSARSGTADSLHGCVAASARKGPARTRQTAPPVAGTTRSIRAGINSRPRHRFRVRRQLGPVEGGSPVHYTSATR